MYLLHPLSVFITKRAFLYHIHEKVHVGVVIIMNLLVAFSVEYLEWIELPNAEVLPESDDGITGPITISSPGFPFWDSVQTQVYVCL